MMVNDEKPNNKSGDKTAAGCLIVILIAIFAVVFWLLDRGTRSNVPDEPVKQKQTVTLPADTNYNTSSVSGEKLQEMRNAYTQVLTNTLKPICVGTAIRNESWVNVYVNSLWYELNKGQKTEFITRCKNTYVGMLGARGIRIDQNTLNIFINLNTNEKILGKWSTFGVSINE